MSDLYPAWQKVLPDSRVSSHLRRTVMGPLGPMTDAFCINCGRPYGLVTQDFLTGVTVLCNLCFERFGGLPMPPVPTDVERAAMAHD